MTLGGNSHMGMKNGQSAIMPCRAELTKKRNETPYYYYVGHVAEIQHPTPVEKPTADGSDTVKAVVSTLRLARPLEPELFRHLTGRHMA